MKYRYLGFSYESYYPGGGMTDCCIKSNDLNEVIELLKKKERRNLEYHGGTDIYDCETGESVLYKYDGVPIE